MPRKAKGARLVWRDESRKADGSLRSAAGWHIRDGSTFISACGGTGSREAAERRLADYITEKYQPSRERSRDPDAVFVADVVTVYITDKVSRHARPKETAGRLEAVLDFFGEMTLGSIDGKACRDFAATQTSEASARRKLEDLRAAIKHYHKEGYVTSAPMVTLPDKPVARERWLTRDEAARLLSAAWRMRQSWKGHASDRRTGRHLARFILVGLYTGTRSSAICGAAVRAGEGAGFVDYDRGVFYRRAIGTRQTKKRQPPVRLPQRLLAHLRRWRDTPLEIKTKARGKSGNLGRMISQDYVVEWNGKPVGSVKKSFKIACELAGLGWYEDREVDGQVKRVFVTDVTPHTLRHTAATWMMSAGVDPWDAAGFLGMTVDVLISTYGHHHPDFQSDAADKITRKRPGQTASTNVVRLEAKQRENGTPAPHSYPTENPGTKRDLGRKAK